METTPATANDIDDKFLINVLLEKNCSLTIFIYYHAPRHYETSFMKKIQALPWALGLISHALNGDRYFKLST